MKKRPLSKKLRILAALEKRQLERTIKVLTDDPDPLEDSKELIKLSVAAAQKHYYAGVDIGFALDRSAITLAHEENGMLVIDGVVMQGHHRMRALGGIK